VSDSNLKQISFIYVGLLFGCSFSWSQTTLPKLQALTPIVDSKTGYVIPDVGLHEKGDDGLVLPDGSVITRVWSAALQISTYQIPSSPPLPKRPVEWICEPAVYGFARYTREGIELWAKSYIFKGKIEKVCFAYHLGFDIFSSMLEVERLGYYVTPFNGRVVIGSSIDLSPQKLEIDVETGEVFGVTQPKLVAVDISELRKIKENIWFELNEFYPEPEFPNNSLPENIKEFAIIRNANALQRYQFFFKRLEAALF
jgi:hypothetical protein